MKKLFNNPFAMGIVNIVLSLLIFLLLIIFYENESSLLTAVTFVLIFIGVASSIRGLMLSIKALKTEDTPLGRFLFHILSNALFIVVLISLTLGNTTDFVRLFY